MTNQQYPGLYLRGKIWWMKFQLNGASIHRSTGQTEEDKAYEVLISLQMNMLEYERSIHEDTVTMGLREAIDITDIEKLRNGRDWKQSCNRLEVIYRILGDIKMHTIDKSTFKRLERRLRKRNIKNSSINRYFSHLNVVMTHVCNEHAVNCRERITGIRLKANSHRIRVISHTEENLIRDWFKSHKIRKHYAGWRNRDLVEIFDVLMATGMRRGEMFGFRVDQVRGDAIILHEHKTMNESGERSIALNNTALQIIQNRIERYQLKPADRVFPYSKNAYTILFRRMRVGIGYGHDKDLVVHTIRHTFASRLAARGASLYEVSKLLGHSTVTTTERYAHLFNKQLVKTVRLLDSL